MKTVPTVLALMLLAPALGPAPAAQEEPPLFETPEPETPPEEAPGEVPKGPLAPLPPAEAPAPPARPLSERLDFARWQEMSPRERQTFVEGAVASLAGIMSRLQAEVAAEARGPHERRAALQQFIKEHSPRRAAAVYLRGMYNIYHTEDGRGLSMQDCFLLAYRRLNAQ
jgi:hypothetical protein